MLCSLGARAGAAHPLSLAEALATAAARRSELKQADLDILRASIGLLQARLERVRLTVGASFTEQAQALNVHAPSSYFSPSSSNYGGGDAARNEAHSFIGGANLTVPIFSGLQVEADIARAHALVDSAREQRRATLLDITVQVVDAYWTVRRAELTQALLESALRRELDIERNTKARVDAGIALLVDYYRAHVQVLRQQSQIKAIAEQREAAMANLAAVLQIEDSVVLTDEPPVSAPPPPALDGAEHEALRARPELHVAAAQVEAQRQAVRRAKSAYWPQLSIVGAATAQNQAFFPTVGPPSQRDESVVGNFFIGAQVNWVAFDMLTTYLNVKDAEAVRARLEHETARQRYLILANVRATWLRLRYEIDRLTIVQETARTAQDTIDALRKRYAAGSAGIYEVTAAEDQLVAVDTDLIDTRIAIAQAHAELRAAIGQARP